MDSPATSFDFGARRRRTMAALAEVSDAPALLITSPVNVAWLTGFTGSNTALLVSEDAAILATDRRYQDQAAEQAPNVEVVVQRAVGAALIQTAGQRGIAEVAVEAEEVSVALLERLQRVAGPLAVELSPTADLVPQLRMIKEPGEVELLARACRISCEALAALVPDLRAGMSEIQIARDLEARMGALGAQDRAFPTIVASGPNSAIPHHEPTSRETQPGDLLKIDFGARVQGYNADCTRTFVVGAEPSQWQREIHDLVQFAAAQGRAALVPGVRLADVDAAARSVIAGAGYGLSFTHGLGHGIGLEIHESPLFAAMSVGTLNAGVVATIEPGVYLPGRGGVRIEDTCSVTPETTEVLTQAPRELVRLG